MHALIKVNGGWKIRLETGKVFPRVYPTAEAGVKRISELRRHANKVTQPSSPGLKP